MATISIISHMNGERGIYEGPGRAPAQISRYPIARKLMRLILDGTGLVYLGVNAVTPSSQRPKRRTDPKTVGLNDLSNESRDDVLKNVFYLGTFS